MAYPYFQRLMFRPVDENAPDASVSTLEAIEVTSLDGLPVSHVGSISLKPPVYPDSAPKNVTSIALEASHVVKTTAGVLYGFSGYNNKGSAQFIQLYDAAALPAEGGIPVMVITVPATSNFSYSPGPFGRRFENGIVIGNSSTAATKTIGSADCWFDLQVV